MLLNAHSASDNTLTIDRIIEHRLDYYLSVILMGDLFWKISDGSHLSNWNNKHTVYKIQANRN